jgi:hypothetical protein
VIKNTNGAIRLTDEPISSVFDALMPRNTLLYKPFE